MRSSLLLLAALCATAAAAQDAPPPKRVAVVVHHTTPQAEKLVSTAQTRLEQILADNAIEVIDRDESDKIKDVWKKLEDPGYFVTADDFVRNTRQYDIDALVRVYLAVDVEPSFGGFFSASAQADVRLVDPEAKVQAQTSYPMGAPGRPPSDGLTAQAALINAVQRAVDEAAGLLKLTVTELASPRAVALRLDGPVTPTPSELLPRPVSLPLDAADQEPAVLAQERWSQEIATCSAKARGGGVGAVGGWVHQLNRGGRKVYGSRVHVLDLVQRREITVFQTQDVGLKPREHRGTSALLDCKFVSGWRYLAALTGDLLSLWDTERGLKLSEVLLPFGLEEGEGRIEALSDGRADYLRVAGAAERSALYRIMTAK